MDLTKLYVDAATPSTPSIKKVKSPRGTTPAFFGEGETGTASHDSDGPKKEQGASSATAGEGGGMPVRTTTATADDQWVQCDKCSKWRRLPPTVDLNKLPSKWYCHMNKYNTEKASCEAPEEEYTEVVGMPGTKDDVRMVWMRNTWLGVYFIGLNIWSCPHFLFGCPSGWCHL